MTTVEEYKTELESLKQSIKELKEEMELDITRISKIKRNTNDSYVRNYYHGFNNANIYYSLKLEELLK